MKLGYPLHNPRAIAMKAAVKAKPSPNCSRLGKAAPTNAPPAVEAVHTLMSTRPDPIRNEAPTSFAGDGFDGASAVHSHMTNTRMTDPEVLETRFPVRLNEFSIRNGSGGQGRFNGGNGIVRKLQFLEPMTVTMLSSHRIITPHGAKGGDAGAIGENSVIRANGEHQTLRGNDEISVLSGDVVVLKSPGGGGFGERKQKSVH